MSLDLDLAPAPGELQRLGALFSPPIRIERFQHSVNLSASGSDLRIQLQADPRYQEFPARAEPREVLGHRLPVARLDDVLRGKVGPPATPPAAPASARRLSRHRPAPRGAPRVARAGAALAPRPARRIAALPPSLLVLYPVGEQHRPSPQLARPAPCHLVWLRDPPARARINARIRLIPAGQSWRCQAGGAPRPQRPYQRRSRTPGVLRAARADPGDLARRRSPADPGPGHCNGAETGARTLRRRHGQDSHPSMARGPDREEERTRTWPLISKRPSRRATPRWWRPPWETSPGPKESPRSHAKTGLGRVSSTGAVVLRQPRVRHASQGSARRTCSTVTVAMAESCSLENLSRAELLRRANSGLPSGVAGVLGSACLGHVRLLLGQPALRMPDQGASSFSLTGQQIPGFEVRILRQVTIRRHVVLCRTHSQALWIAWLHVWSGSPNSAQASTLDLKSSRSELPPRFEEPLSRLALASLEAEGCAACSSFRGSRTRGLVSGVAGC